MWPEADSQAGPLLTQSSENGSPTALPANGPHRTVRLGRDLDDYFDEQREAVNRREQKDVIPPHTDCRNDVTTSHYTLNPLSPKFIVTRNLFEQFQRLANVYFLLVASIQIIPGISPTGRFTTILPLGFVMFVSMLKDGYEDYKRHQLDAGLNNSPCRVFGSLFPKGPKTWRDAKWSEVRVGDLLRVNKGEAFPADMVILSTSEPEGLAYVETSSLDGETNLKIRKTCSAAYRSFDERRPQDFSATITHELPNNRLDSFEGNIAVRGANAPAALFSESIVLRGAALRNTQYLFGVVIFTGMETKLMKNSSKKEHKMSHMDHTTNRQVLFIFCFQMVVCFLCTIGLGVYLTELPDHWYLDFSVKTAAATVGIGFLTFLILFNNLIPISLYVSMEMVKLFQASLINADQEMYYEVTDTPSLARTSALNEELGEVSYIFSDKTGTLTCNVMEFLKFSCISADGKDAIRYGSGVTEIARAAAARRGEVLEETKQQGGRGEGSKQPGYNFADDRITDGRWAFQPNSRNLEMFLLHLCVCHTVVAEYSGNVDDSRAVYQAASPDELCLVQAARELGAVFTDRTERDMEISLQGKVQRYQLLNVIEFDSTRKRMSIVVRSPNNEILLLCKGADSVIYERLRKSSDTEQLLTSTLSILTEFAAEGLRTLVLAIAVLDEATYQQWDARYQAALCSPQGRAEKVAAAAEEIERDLTLVGTTAIEDKLQDGVPSTIELLIGAGVRVWVLTGDKQETAINIGFACALLNNTMNLMLFDNETASTIAERIRDFKRRADADAKSPGGADLGLVIQGGLLITVLEDDALSQEFLALACMCKSVICCRVSPLQKAQVVLLVKQHVAESITLAIGDGANDVSMIQSAHVGIGISGLEGQQAARASDYSIAQFKFLQRLLLVHGRWNCRRIARLILYSFYKNITLYLTQMWFCLFNAFTGTSLIDPWALALYNVWFTAFPIMFLAVLDKDILPQRILSIDGFPELYEDGMNHRLFNTKVFWKYIVNAIFHSALSFFVPLLSLISTQRADIMTAGITVYSCVLFVVTGKVSLETLSWTKYNLAIVLLSLGIWYAFLMVYTNLFQWMNLSDFFTWFGAAGHVLTEPLYWLTVLLVLVGALVRDVAWKVYRKNFNQELSHVVQVLEGRGEPFTRHDCPPRFLRSLESLAPKASTHRFAVAEEPHGYSFSQEEGQREYLNVLATATALTRRHRANSAPGVRSSTVEMESLQEGGSGGTVRVAASAQWKPRSSRSAPEAFISHSDL